MNRTQGLINKSITFPIFVMMVLLISSKSAFAGTTPIGTIDFSIPGAAGATGIPTLSGTMLIVLSILLFIVAFRVSKQSDVKSNKLFVSLLGVFALSSGFGGFKTISDVHAGTNVQQALTLTLNTATTGDAPITGPTTNYYDNSFGVPVTILSINYDREDFSCNNPVVIETTGSLSKDIVPFSPICSDIAPDNIIPIGAQCQLSCFGLSMDDTDLSL